MFVIPAFAGEGRDPFLNRMHVAAALMHRIVRRNAILERMLPLRRPG